jgi:uncharacterized protein (DUF1697 family)
VQYVAFLRGINVGKRQVKKEAFVASFGALGYDDVSTFIASGNVLFSTGDARSGLEAAIERRLEADLGFEVTTFVRTAKEVLALADASPFDEDAGANVYVGFLKAAPRTKRVLTSETDEVRVVGKEFWWRIAGGMMDTKLKPKDWREVPGLEANTTRNLTTIRKLAAKL